MDPCHRWRTSRSWAGTSTGKAVAPEEVDELVAAMSTNPGAVHTAPEVIRAFLEEDDGEFVMLNLIRLCKSDIEHPETGASISPSALVPNTPGPSFLNC